MWTRRSLQVAATLLAVFGAAGSLGFGSDPLSLSARAAPATETAPAAKAAPPAEAFPRFETLEGNVAFWVHVFAVWRLDQVAVHDLEHPQVLFQVVDLPGPVEERYTEEQRDFVEDLADHWRDWLGQLEHKVARGQPLDDREKEWALHITTHGGSGAIEGVHERVRTQRGLRERFRRGLEISTRYDGRFREIFRAAGLPEGLAYLPHVESSFQADARSSAGAVGIWQFTRSTGRKYLAITSAVDERLDPIAAARGAAAYLKDAFEELESWPLALTSYNYGVAGMRRAVEHAGNDYERIVREYKGRAFGFASKNFYSEFIAAMEIARDPASYFPEGFDPDPPLDLEAVALDGRTTPGRIARAYGIPVGELATINPAWSDRAVRSGLSLPKGLTVWLPRGTRARLEAEGREPDHTLAGWIDDQGSYVVQPGDSLSVIAETYGIGLSRLRELNGIPAGKSLIRAGQHLKLGDDRGEAVHVVQRGETLTTIARTYRMSLDELRRLNGLPPNESLIRVGQRLRVHDAPSSFHVVRPGETLLRIALIYGIKLADLLHLNSLTERSIIYPGQKIRIR